MQVGSEDPSQILEQLPLIGPGNILSLKPQSGYPAYSWAIEGN